MTIKNITKITSSLLFVYLLSGLTAVTSIIFRQWLIAALIVGFIVFINIYPLFRTKPEVFVIVSLFLSYLPHGMFISYPLIYILLIILFGERIIKKQNIVRIDIIIVLWSSIIALGLLSVYKWHDIFSGVQWIHALAAFPLALYILILGDYITEKGIQDILNYGIPIILGIIVVETYIDLISRLLQQNALLNVTNIYAFRTLSIPGNGSNRLAGILAFLSMILIINSREWKGKWVKKILFSSLICLALIIPFIMLSRGALIFFIVTIIIYGSGRYLVDKKVNIRLMLIASFVALLLIKPFIDQMIYRVQNIKYDISTISRLIVWKDSLYKIKSGLIIGSGPGQIVYRALSDRLEDPHNMFLRYGVEFGGVSILIVLAILLYPLMLFIKHYRIAPKSIMKIFLFLGPPLIGTFIHSQIDSTFTSRNSGLVIWLLWAIFVRTLKNCPKLD